MTKKICLTKNEKVEVLNGICQKKDCEKYKTCDNWVKYADHYISRTQYEQYRQNKYIKRKYKIIQPKPPERLVFENELFDLLSRDEQKEYEKLQTTSFKKEHPKYPEFLGIYKKDHIIKKAEIIRILGSGAPLETDPYGQRVKNEVVALVELGYGHKMEMYGCGTSEKLNENQNKAKRIKFAWWIRANENEFNPKIRNIVPFFFDRAHPLPFSYSEEFILYIILLGDGLKTIGIPELNMIKYKTPNCVIDFLIPCRCPRLENFKTELSLSEFDLADEKLAEWNSMPPPMSLLRIKPKSRKLSET